MQVYLEANPRIISNNGAQFIAIRRFRRVRHQLKDAADPQGGTTLADTVRAL
jgi:hypothetical protein